MHGPALDVLPVFIPLKFLFDNSLFVFDHYNILCSPNISSHLQQKFFLLTIYLIKGNFVT